MAITFSQAKKRQRYMILILALVIFLILLIVWWGFFKEEGPGSTLPVIKPVLVPPEIKINWQTLEEFALEEFRVFEEISPFQEEIGRENPFLPY